MKKWLLAIALVVLVPTLALAAEFRSGEGLVSLGANEVIQDDIYTAASTVDVRSTVEGDLFVAGGTINIDGKITGDVFAAGGTIILSGEVDDDVRITGGNLTISGVINDDLLIAGGEVNITESAIIKGQVFLGAGTAVIAGEVGSVKAGVGDLVVEKTAIINGDLTYSGDKEADISTEAQIIGSVNFNLVDTGSSKFAMAGFSILWWITGIILAGLLMVLLPNKTEKLVKSWPKDFWRNLLTGFVFIVAAPIAAFIIMFTVVGAPIGIGFMLLLPIIMFVAKLLAVIAVGYWVQKMLSKKTSDKPTWLSILIGALLIAGVAFLPLAGWLVVFIVTMASLGGLIRYDWSLLKTLRHNRSL